MIQLDKLVFELGYKGIVIISQESSESRGGDYESATYQIMAINQKGDPVQLEYYWISTPYKNDSGTRGLKTIGMDTYKVELTNHGLQDTVAWYEAKRHENELRSVRDGVLSNNTPNCLDCNVPMVIRRNGNTGSAFFGCANFPNCRRTTPMSSSVEALFIKYKILSSR